MAHPEAMREREAGIPSEGWDALETAPRDGTIFAVRFHEWNNRANPAKMQFAQWLAIKDRPHAPYDLNGEVYADAWMPLEKLNAMAIVWSAEDPTTPENHNG